MPYAFSLADASARWQNQGTIDGNARGDPFVFKSAYVFFGKNCFVEASSKNRTLRRPGICGIPLEVSSQHRSADYALSDHYRVLSSVSSVFRWLEFSGKWWRLVQHLGRNENGLPCRIEVAMHQALFEESCLSNQGRIDCCTLGAHFRILAFKLVWQWLQSLKGMNENAETPQPCSFSCNGRTSTQLTAYRDTGFFYHCDLSLISCYLAVEFPCWKLMWRSHALPTPPTWWFGQCRLRSNT